MQDNYVFANGIMQDLVESWFMHENLAPCVMTILVMAGEDYAVSMQPPRNVVICVE